MNILMASTLDQPNAVERTTRKKTRNRRPLPPLQAREWMTANEAALTLGCSAATIHRLRRGLISGVELLPCSQYVSGVNYFFGLTTIISPDQRQLPFDS